MCPVIRVSDNVYKKLGSLVIGFETPESVIIRLLKQTGHTIEEKEKIISENILPIILNPSDENVFKKLLLLKKNAIIKIIYNNGKVVERVWKANRISPESNVIGNLRSRPEFRQGEWQRRKISKVEVSIDKN